MYLFTFSCLILFIVKLELKLMVNPLGYKSKYSQLISLTDYMDSKSEDSIQVCIRVKPGSNEDSILQFTQTQIHLDKNHFGFDKIFNQTATQEQIFQAVGTKVISHTLEGFNGCIFVYGQTGSGKTYTMMGENNGLMQQSFIHLFKQIESLQRTQWTVFCSYYEIYNQQIIDLLDNKRDKKLNIRQDTKKGVFIQNIVEQSITNSYKLLECLNTGMRNRHVGETNMNRQSSRSHSIFTVSIYLKNQINGYLKTPKLHFVDLAGSQRQKMTAATGQRLKQAGNINKSLTTLGMVINALASERARTHIPYRDSKLTSLLRDSLGGNSKTFLIATVSTNILCFQETLSTLHFANRAKMVKVKAIVNQQSLSTNIETYKQQIRRLKAQILKLKTEKKTPSRSEIFWQANTIPSSETNPLNYDDQFRQLNDKISVISDHLVKNPSPSFDELFEQLKRLRSPIGKNNEVNGNENEMIDQSNGFTINEVSSNNMNNQEQDPLIQYLSCNNALLQKIHTKVEEYMEMKDQLRNVAYNNHLTIASLKTPSKFEREQLEGLIDKRNEQIIRLESLVKQYKNLVWQRQLRISEIENMVILTENKKEESLEKHENEKLQLQRELNIVRNLQSQHQDQIQSLRRKYKQMEEQCKQNKDLYLFAEQNYETERILRNQLEKNLMEKINEIELVRLDFTNKMEQEKQYFEELEQRLKQDIIVLTQTAQFNETMIAEYQQKLSKQRNRASNLNQLIEELQAKMEEDGQEKSILEQKLKQSEKNFIELKEYCEQKLRTYESELKEKFLQINELKKGQEDFMAKSTEEKKDLEEKINRLNQEIESVRKENVQLVYQYNERQNQYEKAINQIHNSYQSEVQALKRKLGEQESNYNVQIISFEEKLREQEGEKDRIRQQNELLNIRLKQKQQFCVQITQEADKRIQSIYQQSRSKLQSVRILEIENEEFKKQYKILQKENYKIKARVSENANKTQQQLAHKVDYYEEKFKLMSIEYQKATEVVKKLKQRQLSQAQKIMTLEENQKVLKISYSNSNQQNEGEIMKSLSNENTSLKKENQALRNQISKQEFSQSYLNKVTVQQEKSLLKEKEDYFKKKIQESIQRWDPSKENNDKNKTLQELIHSWEEIEAESCKKFDAITKGIKREQKLKSQNNLILKENIYLKQQINGLEKHIQEQMGHPKKKVKIDLMQIPQQISE